MSKARVIALSVVHHGLTKSQLGGNLRLNASEKDQKGAREIFALRKFDPVGPSDAAKVVD